MLYIGADHAGWELKENLLRAFREEDREFEDLSLPEFDSSDDYPDIALKVAEKVARTGKRGIMICGTGTGAAIAANKVKGVRAASLKSVASIMLGRLHNNINLLCLSGLRFKEDVTAMVKSGNYQDLLSVDSEPTPKEEALEMIEAFLNTPFEGGRHERRINKIAAYEKG